MKAQSGHRHRPHQFKKWKLRISTLLWHQAVQFIEAWIVLYSLLWGVEAWSQNKVHLLRHEGVNRQPAAYVGACQSDLRTLSPDVLLTPSCGKPIVQKKSGPASAKERRSSLGWLAQPSWRKLYNQDANQLPYNDNGVAGLTLSDSFNRNPYYAPSLVQLLRFRTGL